MKKEKDTARTPGELLEELKALVAEAEAMTADSLSEHTTEALANLRDRYNAAQERLAEFYEQAKTKVVAGARYTDATIRENPYQALAIALGVGLLAGVLLGRRSK